MKRLAVILGCLLVIVLGWTLRRSSDLPTGSSVIPTASPEIATPEPTPLPMPEVVLDEALTKITSECTFELADITTTPTSFLSDLKTALEESSCPKYDFFQVILSHYPHDLRFVDIQNLPYMGISSTDLYFDGHFLYQSPQINVIVGLEPIGDHLTFLRYGDQNLYGHGYVIVSDQGEITTEHFEPFLSLPYIDDQGWLRYDVMTKVAYGLQDFGKEHYCTKLAPDHSQTYSTSYKAQISPEGKVGEPEVTSVTKVADICDS